MTRNARFSQCNYCNSGRDDEREQDYFASIGPAETSFAESMATAKYLSRLFGCSFYVQPVKDSDRWEVAIRAACIYSIIEQLNLRVAYDHVNETYVRKDHPLVVASGLTLPDAFARLVGLTANDPALRFSLTRCEDRVGWQLNRTRTEREERVYTVEERISMREEAENDLREVLDDIEHGLYAKSGGEAKIEAAARARYERVMERLAREASCDDG